MTRGFAACSKLRPKFTGGKLKQYSGFKGALQADWHR